VTLDVPEVSKWLEQTPVGAAIRESLWWFPAIETLHLLGMAVLVSAITAVDLRLMGVALRRVRVSELTRRLFPWAWAGFSVQVITGALLFSSEATKMVVNPAFRLKMLLIGLAGVHALVFRWIACRDMPAWEEGSPTPLRGKVAGLISLSLWIGVVAAGRWIGFI
jgi:hypothetical protein